MIYLLKTRMHNSFITNFMFHLNFNLFHKILYMMKNTQIYDIYESVIVYIKENIKMIIFNFNKNDRISFYINIRNSKIYILTEPHFRRK